MVLSALSPLIAHEPKMLILGSMPGRMSLELQQYYAHPRNAFWSIMSHLFDVDLNLNYPERVSTLTSKGVAVWDVLYNCDRVGSLDSNIKRDSELVNDFHAFFKRNESIEVVGFNGKTARHIFDRHCKGVYALHPNVKWVDLPSSSPAHAVMSLNEKSTIWAERLTFYVGDKHDG